MTAPEHIAVGASDRSTVPDMRERLPLAADDVAGINALLKANGFAEALVIATRACLEVHAMHARPERGIALLRELLARQLGAGPVSDGLGAWTGADALRRLLLCAAAPDDSVAGEAQAWAALKDGHRRALAAGLIGDGLERRLRVVYRTAGRARREAGRDERTVSIAAAAVGTAREIHGDLGRVGGLLVGSGEAGERIADRLRRHGLARLAVLHERPRVAGAIAGRLEARAAAQADRERELVLADIVILSGGPAGHAVTAPDMTAALAARRRKPVFLVDAAVPSAADPGIARLDDVFLYNLEHLERVALAGRERRAGAAEAVRTIVDEAVREFADGEDGDRESGGVAALRARLDRARRGVLADGGVIDADDATLRLTEDLAARVADALRRLAQDDPETAAAAEEALVRLFGAEEREPREP